MNLFHNYLFYAKNGALELEVIFKKKNLKIECTDEIDVPEKPNTLILSPETKIEMKQICWICKWNKINHGVVVANQKLDD